MSNLNQTMENDSSQDEPNSTQTNYVRKPERHLNNTAIDESTTKGGPIQKMRTEDCVIDVTPGSSNCREHPDLVSLHSIESFVCRICHNGENPERLVSPCLCKGSLTYVHIYCLERWISTSRCTTCELCQFQYNTQQTLRYTCLESLRMWYSRSLSRRALQEDCQMFSLLTLVAFGIIGTLLVAVQYYILQGHVWGLGRLWTKGWLIFFLFTTLVVYIFNVYMIGKSQLTPWYRWWQSTRDIRLILENRKPFILQQIKTDIYQIPKHPELIATSNISKNETANCIYHPQIADNDGACQNIGQSSPQIPIRVAAFNTENVNNTLLPLSHDSSLKNEII